MARGEYADRTRREGGDLLIVEFDRKEAGSSSVDDLFTWFPVESLIFRIRRKWHLGKLEDCEI